MYFYGSFHLFTLHFPLFVLVFSRAHNINSSQQESKESVVPTIRTVRGRLQRPRPNIRKIGQRHIEKGEAKGIVEEEKTVVQKDETKKLLTVVSYCYIIKLSLLMHVKL